MSEEKYGFVYIWRDRKYNRYYIGCHWGTTEDGYVCSSSWMKLSYKKRPQDFKRRILAKNLTRKEMYEKEQYFFNKIKPEEIKVRYYNLNLSCKDPWHKHPEKNLTIGQKISAAKKGKSVPCSADKAKKISEAKLGKKRKIILYKGIEKQKFDFINKEELISNGWSETKPLEYIAFKKENQRKVVSEKLTGIKREGPRSEKQTAHAKANQIKMSQNKELQAVKSAKMSAKKWYHNPITKQNGRFELCPEGWKAGRNK